MTRFPTLRRLRRRLLAHRRALAALCAALAVLAAFRAQAAPPPPRTEVLTAASDVAGGSVLRPEDLGLAAYDPASVPQGAFHDASEVVGRTTAAPLRAGEPLTDVRLVAPSVLHGYPDLVAVPVRLGDPDAAALLRVGDRVDLLAADPQGGHPARAVGSRVPVLALPRPRGDSTTSGAAPGGALVVVGVPPDSARVLTAASATSYLAAVLVN
jgi:Flp pilus assembly protein CpaB